MGSDGSLNVFLVAGEESGDQLGAELMVALRQAVAGDIGFSGVGGSRMEAAGLHSLFPLSDIALAGATAIIAHLPRLIRRVHQTVDAAVARRPDAVVIIDSPDFTHPVARRIRRKTPQIPIIDYVCPSVWAWRPGRARKMTAYVDSVLAILPFEPGTLADLGGPRCTYVGHPLAARRAELRPGPGERPDIGAASPPRLLVLPGSRRSEVKRLMNPFGKVLGLLHAAGIPFMPLVPAVGHLADEIAERASHWPVSPQIIRGEAAKLAAFRSAHAALAASGTVTLELALAKVPMVVAYRLDPIARNLKWLASIRSIVLANLVLEENAIPEFVDRESHPERLAAALRPLLADTAARRAQLAAFARIDEKMALENGESPAHRAARCVLKEMGRAG